MLVQSQTLIQLVHTVVLLVALMQQTLLVQYLESTVNMETFASSPDYENPADADTNNVYVVTVLIDDGANDDANGATTLTITVADLNDRAPVYQAADADDAISVAEGFLVPVL